METQKRKIKEKEEIMTNIFLNLINRRILENFNNFNPNVYLKFKQSQEIFSQIS